MKKLLSFILPLCAVSVNHLFGDCVGADVFYHDGSAASADLNCYSPDASTSQYAGWTGNYCAPSDVYLGRSGINFEAGFAPMWLLPIGSNLNYAAEATPLPIQSPDWEIFELKPSYAFGFDANLGIFFEESNTWISLDYQHFESSYSSHEKVSIDTNMIGPMFEIGPDTEFFGKVHGHVRYNFDEFKVAYGTNICLNQRLTTKLFGGIFFTRIRQSVKSLFSSTDDTLKRNIEVPSTFTGIGPQLGIDFAYRVWNSLDFTGRTLGGVLIGRASNHTEYVTSSPLLTEGGFPNPNYQRTQVQNKTQAVPVFGQRLGISYDITCGDCYEITIELGYEAKVYFNAIQSVDMGSEVDTPPLVPQGVGVYARTFHKTLSNFVLAGPYLNFNLAF